MVWQLFIPHQTTPITTTQTGQTTTNGLRQLNFWGVFDDPSVYQPFIDQYEKRHPNIQITYTQKDASLYELASLNLLASQDGPDIWLIPQDWLPKHRDKLAPIPEYLLAKTNLPAPKKPSLFQKAPAALTNAQAYSKIFAPVTAAENVVNGQVYTMPLSIDSLGLFANTGLLTAAGINRLPQTWEDVVADTKILTKKTDPVTISQSAIGLGTSNNISSATDILATIMIQNHTPMISADKTTALFNQQIAKSTGEPIEPGLDALDFYTSFASPSKETYTWSAKLPLDYDQFASGKLPFMIDYSYRVHDLLQQSPTLSFQTATFPQIAGTNQKATLATALVLGVPTVSHNQVAAWDFISYLTNKTNELAYARAAYRPPARLDALVPSAFDPRLGPFISQISYATTWYRSEINLTDTAFKPAIDAALTGQSLSDVVDNLTKQINHILRNEPLS